MKISDPNTNPVIYRIWLLKNRIVSYSVEKHGWTGVELTKLDPRCLGNLDF